MIATISVWENDLQGESGKPAVSHITCVELVSDERSGTGAAAQWAITPPTDQGRRWKETADKKTKSQRQNFVKLDLALRSLFLRSRSDDDSFHQPPIAYRESQITKVQQRRLEDSNIVVVASVSPLSSEHTGTLSTLNFVHRLLTLPGTMASSPFKGKQHDTHRSLNLEGTPLSEHLLGTVGESAVLKQLVSNPRQRLAKVMKGTPENLAPSPSKPDAPDPAPPKTLETPFDEDGDDTETYQPVDYMYGLDLRMSPMNKDSSRSQLWSPELAVVNPGGRGPAVDDDKEDNEGRIFPVQDFSKSRFVQTIAINGGDDVVGSDNLGGVGHNQSSLNYSRETVGYEPPMLPSSRNDLFVEYPSPPPPRDSRPHEFSAIPEDDSVPFHLQAQYPHPTAISPKAEPATIQVSPLVST